MAQVYKNAYIVAAQLAGESSTMDHVAGRIENRVKASAAKHKLTGATLRSIHTETTGNGKDRIIVADGEGIVPIEFGYMRMRRFGNSIRMVRYPGLRFMRDAFNSIPETDG